MRKAAVIVLVCMSSLRVSSQVILEANGPGNTYELIDSVFAPGADAVENPECVHPEFGRHIAEVWDSTLQRYVFEFYSHVTPDNDRCINFDRQRVEIKTYEPSPANLKGVVGETVTYKWKFKIAAAYKPSSSFTHLHQIKAVGGDDGNPIFTLTPRKGSPNKMELIHDNTTKVAIVDLALFENTWVECTEVITIDPVNGSYAMTIKNVSNGSTILSYSNARLMTIRPDNTFLRPKWGIYRSLNNASDLRDEAVRFASFSINEGTTGLDGSGSMIPSTIKLGQNYPNPFNPSTDIQFEIGTGGLVSLEIFDVLGRIVAVPVAEQKYPGTYAVRFDGTGLSSGVYVYRLAVKDQTLARKMVLER